MKTIGILFHDVLSAGFATQLFIAVVVLLMGIIISWVFRKNYGQNKWLYTVSMIVILQLLLALLLNTMGNFSLKVQVLVYLFPSLVLAGVLQILLSHSKKKVTNLFDMHLHSSQGKVPINLQRGVAILGAAGSGKTISGFAPIIKHCASNRLAGIIYDYKDFELTEMVDSFYKDSGLPIYHICPHKPAISKRVNPIHPRYLKTFADVNAITSSIISNLAGNKNGHGESFFSEAAESALSAVIWRTKESYPLLCDLPHVIGILLGKDTEAICGYIKSSERARLLGATFLDSAGSDRQMAAVKSTLSNSLRKIVSPELFAIFSGDDFDLALNKQGAEGVLCIINSPKLEASFSPFFGALIRCSINQMSERGRREAVLLFDEFPTIKIEQFGKIPATLRSFNIASVVGLQDKAQGVETYNEQHFKTIMANLSTKLVGKTNDADTSRYYEQFFELEEKEQKGYSKGTSFFTNSETRVNTSTKEKRKHQGYEFFQLPPGEFFIFNEKGENFKRKLKAQSFTIDREERAPLSNRTQEDINVAFDRILAEAIEMA